MAIATTDNKETYTGTGLQTAFPVSFMFFNQEHLKVYLGGVLQSLTTHYTVSPTTNTPNGTAGGTVTFLTAPSLDVQVLIVREVPLTQEVNYVENAKFPADTHERALDLLTMQTQQAAEVYGRSIKVPITSTVTDLEFPDLISANAGKVVRIKGDLSGLETIDMGTTPYSSVLTEKGDLATFDTAQSALSIGSDGDFLEALSSEAKGMKWSSFTDRFLSLLLAKGDTLSVGQCRLDYVSTTQIKLSRFAGMNVPVKVGSVWTVRAIGASGITASNSGMVANTLYYVYVYDSSGTLTLDLSTGGHSADTDTGVEIKTGDATRTLVGMAYSDATSNFISGLVSSWFNRRNAVMIGAFFANRSTGSTSFAEVNSETRTPFLCWANEAVDVKVSGMASNDTLGALITTSIGIDNATARDTMCAGNVYAATAAMVVSCSLCTTLSEGYHYATILGKVGAGTGTWVGSSSAGTRTTVNVKTRG